MALKAQIPVHKARGLEIFTLTASPEKSAAVWKSIGVTTEILLWFSQGKVAEMQLLNRFWYKIAVSRVQTKFKLPYEPVHFALPYEEWGNYSWTVNAHSMFVMERYNEQADFSGYITV